MIPGPCRIIGQSLHELWGPTLGVTGNSSAAGDAGFAAAAVVMRVLEPRHRTEAEAPWPRLAPFPGWAVVGAGQRVKERSPADERPTYYRAGALGPDAYPDLLGGQLWTHVNKGSELGVPSDVPLESRSFKAWRSIDYGMVLLNAAKSYYPASSPNQGEAHLQALAFAYGYLSHMAADGFAHGWVDDWARGVFSYTKGQGLYGPFTEELQHISVEAFLDAHLRATDDEVRIDTPVEFLNSLFLTRLTVTGSADSISPGAFAGPYYEELITIRNKLQEMSHWGNWTRGIQGPGGAAVRAAATTQGVLMRSIDRIGNPVADIEDFFRRRSVLVDGALQRWVELSGCIAQNLARAGTRGAGQIIVEDACASIDFERGFQGELRSLFKGSLNEAAHFPNRILDKDGNRLAPPILQREYDFSKTGTSIKKPASGATITEVVWGAFAAAGLAAAYFPRQRPARSESALSGPMSRRA